MVKNLNQDQVKSKGEEENKKPGLWERTKQILKPAALIAAATIGFLLGGPIGVALVLGVSAFVSHKIDQRNARKNADKDNKGNKNNSDSRDKENKKEGKGPGFLKRALFIAGAIALGVLTGGLAGPIAAIALIVFDFASGGKLTKWSEKVITAPFKLIKEAWSKGKEIQWTSKRGAGEETEQKKGKEQAAGQGVAGEGLKRSEQKVAKPVSGFDNPHYSSPAVQAENPNVSVVKAEGTVQKSSPGGKGDDGSAISMPAEVKSQVEEAAKPLVEAAKPGDGVEVAQGNLRQSSTDGPSTSNQPVTPEVQRQATQAAEPLVEAAKPGDGVEVAQGNLRQSPPGGTKTNREVVGDATERLSKEDSADRALSGRT